MRFGIWRFAVAPSDAAETNCNIGAQLQSIRCTKAPNMFGKICFLYDFWCAQTCSFRAVFGLPIRNLTIAGICYCDGIFFKSLSAIYTKWCAQTFPPIFGLFAIFDRNFGKIVAPSSDENENYIVLLKEQSLLKKNVENRVEIWQ